MEDNDNLGIGTDADGNLVTIGDVDSMGYRVGYIDETGLAWESQAERDSAVFNSVYFDTPVKDRLNVEPLLVEAGVAGENITRVLTETLESLALREVFAPVKDKIIERLNNNE